MTTKHASAHEVETDMIDLELFRLICRVEALGTKGDELGRALRAARRISFAMLPSWRKKELDA